MAEIKPIKFLESSLEELCAFQRAARREIAYRIDQVQSNEKPYGRKRLGLIGDGVWAVHEVVEDDDTFRRAIYFEREEYLGTYIGPVLYILHCSQNVNKQTDQADISAAAARYGRWVEAPNWGEEATAKRFSNVWDATEDSPEDASLMKYRSHPMMCLTACIARESMTETQAAKTFRVTPDCISKILSGKIDALPSEVLWKMMRRIPHRDLKI